MRKENGKIKIITLVIIIFLLAVAFIATIILNKQFNPPKSNTKKNTVSQPIQNNDEIIVLYKGLDISVDDLETSIPTTDENQKKYEINYYNYENGKFVREGQGKLEEIYHGYSSVTNTEKIAISKNYNAIPRTYNEIENLPKELMEFADNNKVQLHSIDLDGDNKLEYILAYSNFTSPDNYDVDEYSNFSEIIILDDSFNKIATLVKSENQFTKIDGKIHDEFFCSLEDVEYIDIDNDGTMEILIDTNVYEGIGVNIYKYENGSITGKTDYKIVAMP